MQDWLLRRYRTRGASYVALCLWMPAALILVLVPPVSTAVLSRYDGLSLAQWLVSLGAAEGPIALAVLVAWLVGRRDIATVSSWARGERDRLAPADVAEAVRRLPRRMFLALLLIAVGVGGPVGAFTTLSEVDHVHIPDLALLMLSGGLYATWAIVALAVWAEVAIRPVLYDLAEADPTLPCEGAFRWQLSTQIAAAVGTGILIGGLYSGAVIRERGASFDELRELVFYGLVVTVAFGVLLVPLYLAWLAEPLRALTRASRKVASGDMTARIGITSNDELGELSQAFNAMVDGLAERDSLRATNSALVADLRESQRRLVAASDSARRQVETDLHDGAQQQLALVRLQVSMVNRRITSGGDASAALNELESSLSRAINDLNELAQGIYPERLEADGISGALEHALSFVPHPSHLETVGIGRYRSQIETAVYFCCREAFQNVTKHAGEAARISVNLREEQDVLTFVVADDGVGFEVAATSSSGLQNITDRLSSLNGSLDVVSMPGAGTTLTGKVPLP